MMYHLKQKVTAWHSLLGFRNKSISRMVSEWRAVPSNINMPIPVLLSNTELEIPKSHHSLIKLKIHHSLDSSLSTFLHECLQMFYRRYNDTSKNKMMGPFYISSVLEHRNLITEVTQRLPFFSSVSCATSHPGLDLLVIPCTVPALFLGFSCL